MQADQTKRPGIKPDSERPAPSSTTRDAEYWRWCPRCGHELYNDHCKLKCPKCHYFLSCSDFD